MNMSEKERHAKKEKKLPLGHLMGCKLLRKIVCLKIKIKHISSINYSYGITELYLIDFHLFIASFLPPIEHNTDKQQGE